MAETGGGPQSIAINAIMGREEKQADEIRRRLAEKKINLKRAYTSLHFDSSKVESCESWMQWITFLREATQ